MEDRGINNSTSSIGILGGEQEGNGGKEATLICPRCRKKIEDKTEGSEFLFGVVKHTECGVGGVNTRAIDAGDIASTLPESADASSVEGGVEGRDRVWVVGVDSAT
ncbi:hypothetical protein AX774_g3151, partial [Zancudomyces culisetae]